jgi:hypothetical protein
LSGQLSAISFQLSAFSLQLTAEIHANPLLFDDPGWLNVGNLFNPGSSFPQKSPAALAVG